MFKKFSINTALKKKFVYWNVNSAGDILLKSTNYLIRSSDLNQKNWFDYILVQNYEPEVKVEFYYAYKQALINARYKYILMDLKDPNHIDFLY